MRSKHRFQRLAAVLACLMLCVCLVPQAVSASNRDYRYKQLTDEQMKAEYSLSLEFSSGETKFSGARFRIYKVAEMDREARFTGLSEGFDNETYEKLVRMGQINDPEYTNANWLALASTLASYVGAESTRVEPVQSRETDADGKVEFSGLGVGLYLVLGDARRVELGYGYSIYTPTPFLVAIPSWDAGTESWGSANIPLSAQAKVTINSYNYPNPTVGRRVTKIWEDEGHEDERPESVTVQLLRNGTVYDSVELNEGNNWRYAWTGLSAGSNWTLVEVLDNERYAPLITQEGMTFVMTNTYQEDIEDPDNPLGPAPSFPVEPSEPPAESDEPVAPGPEVPAESDEPVAPSPEVPAESDEPIGPEESAEPEEPTAPIPEDPEESAEPKDPDEELDDPDIPQGELPQTGQLWWPVPVLGTAGTVMVLVGLIRRRGGSAV